MTEHDPDNKACPQNDAQFCHFNDLVLCACEPVDAEQIRESYAPGTKPHSESACSCDRCADWIDGRDLLTLVDTQAAEIKRLRDALQEVSRALGPYTRDPHEFAVGVIEDMQDIALNALVDNWAALKQGSNKE